jgi:hypothetical protein
MAAGDPGSPARYYSSTAVETALGSSIPAQSQGQSNTSFIVGSISGFPTSYPYTLIVDPDTSKEEVVTVTAGSGTTLTVTRGSDNTQAVAHSAGAVVRHGVSGREFRESENHIAARGYDIDETILTAANQTHVHGIATGDGVIVGTSKSQTLTNKVISGGSFTGSITATGAELQNVTLAGTPVITGLSSVGMTATSATPKSYVDSILGSATAAATSAASAAVSATSAATSATSAANSATASANSASAAATSATSAAASATASANSASAAATSATSAAASATAAATSATSAAASASAAAASVATIASYATAAANSATAAATSATSAAASATAASTSATSAAASATAAAASATAAATSATSAAASASAASTSATAAATSATSAATSASAAATSASAAATSATSAAASATSAASSATSAETAWDSFDDRYLGPKATAPTVDNDGNPLTNGVIYYNTTDYNMYVWNGGTSSWQVFTTSGDITAVTAGDGLSGGGTSGGVTLAVSSDVLRTTGGQVISANTSSNAFEIRQTGTGNSFVVEDSTNPDATPFVVNSEGDLGLGTTTPAQKLDISADGGSVHIRQTRYSTDATPAFHYIRKARGTSASPTVVANADSIGGIYFLGYDGTNFVDAARITAVVDGTPGTTDMPTRIVFLTSPDGSATLAERMRISADGTTTINAIADATTTTAARGAGYMGVPQSAAATTGAYTIVAADAGEHIYSTGTRTVTIPANGSVAFPVGTAITFIAATGATVTIAITTDTLLLAGAGTTGSRTLAPFGMATAIKITSTSWIISGNGLS